MTIIHIRRPITASLAEAGRPIAPEGGTPPMLRKLEAFAAPNGSFKTGTWEATPGRFRRAVMDAEFSHFIAGRASFVTDEGHHFDFEAGDAAFFPPATHGTWTVYETLRKTYVIWQAVA